MNITVDSSKLKRAMDLYRRARVGKSYAYITNRALQNCVARAIGPTPKADSAKIAWQMGQVGTKIAYRDRKGNLRRYKTPKRIYDFADSFAARILNKRRRDKGEAQIFGAEMDKEARRMVGARLRSVAFIKSGWLPALKVLSRLIDKPLRILKEGRIVGVDKGFAVPAPKGKAFLYGLAGNNAKGAAKIGTAAAQQAVNETAADMEAWALAELKRQAKDAGFRVR